MSMDSVLARMAESPGIVLNIPVATEAGDVTSYTEVPLVVGDDSYRMRKIMGEHTLNLKFSLPGYYEIPTGTYCDFQGQRYTLETPENIKKNAEANFEYDLILQSDQYKLSKFMLRNTVPGDTRLKFSYTARPQEFLQLLVDNMNARDEDAGWIVGGGYIEAYEKVVSFNHNTCAEALQMIAEAFETEWEVMGKTIYLRKVEYNRDNPLPLSYGKGNGFLPGIGRSEYSNVKPVQRLFVQGGDRNIDASKYRRTDATGQIGSRELLMPANATIKFDGTYFDDEDGFDATSPNVREYITDESGASVVRTGNQSRKSLLEGSLDASSVYPMREGTVTAVEEMSDGWDFWDSSIPDNLDYSNTDLRIAGEKATVIFQTGMLTGKEFDILQTENALTGYIHNDPKNPNDPAKKRGRFKLVSQEIDGIDMPGGVYAPVIGDRYAVFHIGLPQEYIDDAERNMLKQAVRYLYDNETPRFTFTGTLDGIWAARDWVNIGGRIVLGGFIRFSDTQFLPDGMDIRITGVKDYVNSPHKPEIELSNNSKSGSWLHNMKRQIASDEVTVETKDREVVQYAKRRFRDVQETTDMLREAQLDFSDPANPITLQTMQAVVGDKMLQFDFTDNNTGPISSVRPGDNMRGKTIFFNNTDKLPTWIFAAATMTFVGDPYTRISSGPAGPSRNMAITIYYNTNQTLTILNPLNQKWLVTSFTMPDDKDYIVATNDLYSHTTDDDWGFDYTTIVSEDAPKSSFYFDPADENTFHATAGTLTHKTLGIDTISSALPTEYPYHWDMASFRSATLDNPEQAYYLYAVVPDATGGGEGRFELSIAGRPFEDSGMFNLLVGILNSEFNGDRSFAPLYGFTEILPGRITTDKIVSADGKTYFDLQNNEIGGRINFKDGLVSGDIGIGNDNGINAGMSGEGSGTNGANADTDIRMWAGASAANKNTAPFRVQHDGTLFASKANIEGTINATTLNLIGLLTALAGNGSKIVLDPSIPSIEVSGTKGKVRLDANNALSLINSAGKVIGTIEWGDMIDPQASGAISFSGNATGVSQQAENIMNGYGYSFDGAGGSSWFRLHQSNGKLWLELGNLPTSASGQVSGTVWRDGSNYLRIVP